MKKQQKKWIFFDLDGVLADSLSVLEKAYNNFLGRFDIKSSEQEFVNLNGPSLKEIVGLLKARYGLPGKEADLFEFYKKNILLLYQVSVKPMLKAENVLKTLFLNGYKMLLVTSSFQEAVEGFIKKQQWQKYFQGYVFGEEVKRSKPAPDIYQLALQKAKIAPFLAVAVEDSVNGVKSAKQAGIFVIGIAEESNKTKLMQAGADIIFSELRQITNFFTNAKL